MKSAVPSISPSDSEFTLSGIPAWRNGGRLVSEIAMGLPSYLPDRSAPALVRNSSINFEDKCRVNCQRNFLSTLKYSPNILRLRSQFLIFRGLPAAMNQYHNLFSKA